MNSEDEDLYLSEHRLSDQTVFTDLLLLLAVLGVGLLVVAWLDRGPNPVPATGGSAIGGSPSSHGPGGLHSARGPSWHAAPAAAGPLSHQDTDDGDAEDPEFRHASQMEFASRF